MDKFCNGDMFANGCEQTVEGYVKYIEENFAKDIEEIYLVHLTARSFVPELRCTLGRETAIQKMMWIKDHWLRMADGSNLAKVEVPESSLPECKMPQIPDFDDFDSDEQGMWYYSLRLMSKSFADVKVCLGFVRICGQESRTSLNRVSILARKLTSVHARITTKMEFTPEVKISVQNNVDNV